MTKTYRINWDNGHACGTLPGEYETEDAAEAAGEEWLRDMVAMETTAKGRRDARAAYSLEVIEVEAAEELDPEWVPDNPRPEWA